MISFLIISLHALIGFSVVDTSHYQLIVGSYTASGNPGIEVFDVNGESGMAKPLYKKQNSNASYLTTSQDGRYMYSVSEEGDGKSKISAYLLGNKGEFELINSTETIGEAPCFIIYREITKTIYTANYTGGSLSVFKTENGKVLPIVQHIKYKGSSIKLIL